MGCAATYKQVYEDDVVLKVAAITKMTRNLFLAGKVIIMYIDNQNSHFFFLHSLNFAAIIPLFTWINLKENYKNNKTQLNMKNVFPLFILGFIGTSIIRTIGDYTMNNNKYDIWDHDNNIIINNNNGKYQPNKEMPNNKAFYVLTEDIWQEIIKNVGETFGSNFCLGTAMAAVGLSTNIQLLQIN